MKILDDVNTKELEGPSHTQENPQIMYEFCAKKKVV